MATPFRINLMSHSHSRRATIFATVLVAIHWTSIAGLIAWFVQNDSPVSSEERLQLLLFFGFGFYLLLMARDRWRVYRHPPYIEFLPLQILLPRGRYGSVSDWVSYDGIRSF